VVPGGDARHAHWLVVPGGDTCHARWPVVPGGDARHARWLAVTLAMPVGWRSRAMRAAVSTAQGILLSIR